MRNLATVIDWLSLRGFSDAQIADELNLIGVKTKDGHPFTTAEVERGKRGRRAQEKRRELLAKVDRRHTEGEWEQLTALCGMRCICCLRDDVPLERDHVVALSRGGSDGIENIQPLCAVCNSMKGNMNTDYRATFLHRLLAREKDILRSGTGDLA